MNSNQSSNVKKSRLHKLPQTKACFATGALKWTCLERCPGSRICSPGVKARGVFIHYRKSAAEISAISCCLSGPDSVIGSAVDRRHPTAVQGLGLPLGLPSMRIQMKNRAPTGTMITSSWAITKRCTSGAMSVPAESCHRTGRRQGNNTTHPEPVLASQ